MKTYLEIVNDAIAESKLTLDPLVAGNFDSPPRTRLYDDIKRWVNVAYKELLMRRPEQFSRIERTTIVARPRLQLAGLSYTPSVGDVMQGQEGEVRWTVLAIKSAEDVDNSSDLEFTLEVEFHTSDDPRNLVLGESVDRVSPAPATDVGVLKGPGFIDFREEVAGLDSVLPYTVTLQYSNGSEQFYPLTYYGTGTSYPFDLRYPWNGTHPAAFYRNNQGTYSFHPYLREPVRIHFSYNRSMPRLVEWDDIPSEIPEDYDDLLVWKTVAEIADFNNDSKLFARARKHVEDYTNWLDRDGKPQVTLDLYRFG